MKVRPRKHPSGKITWQLDLGEVNGKRVQRSFKKKDEATKALARAREAHLRHGSMASELTGQEMAEFVLTRERLMKASATLTEAVDFYLKHAAHLKHKVLLPELVGKFCDAKWNEDCSARYHRQLKVSLGSLARHLPLKEAHEVMREDVEGWLRGNAWSAKTRNNYVGDVRACFAWAVREGYARVNPALEIAKAKLPDEEIGTLTVTQCAPLLSGAERRPEMMGFVVLGMYGGLRPAEIQRLDWSAVDLEEGTVIVAGSQAKTRRRRVVDLSANAVAWLKTLSGDQRTGAICGKFWDARWRMFRRAAGWAVGSGEKGIQEERVKPVYGEWPHNALRHTYASMHYALHQDEARLQAQMGHESAAMLHRHYRALKTRAEAERFWELLPRL